MAPQLPRADWGSFPALGTDDLTSITWASRGGDGSGKSYFACTAPAPIWVAGFDPDGMRRVDKKIREGKDIRVSKFGFNHLRARDDRTAVKQAAKAIWDAFVAAYAEALKHARTIIWDREDLAWELLRYAAFGGEKNEGSKTGALDYGDLNSEYVSLIQDAHDANVNLGLLQGLTEKWVAKFDPGSGKMRNYNTGEPVPDGFKKVADHVDITLNHEWDARERGYFVTYGKFPNKEKRGTRAANVGFGDMALDAFPDSDVMLWI